MRTKHDILHMLKVLEIPPDIAGTAEHRRFELLIEVMIDIRDIIERWAIRGIWTKEEQP